MKNFHFYLRPFERDASIDVFREIPLSTRGRLYVSPMPYGAYDKGNRLIKMYRSARIRHVFVLAQDEEIRAKAKKDLFKEYDRIGAAYDHFPFIDMHAPDMGAIEKLSNLAVERLASGNVAVHCHAGVGRTSVAVCCIAQAVLNINPADSIAFVKGHMEVNMTPEQCRVVQSFRREKVCA